ncbi:MAG: redox-regulated ATPase YchF [Candidatus Harrisonbacteria bacterium]|nr:redox-regulated ATPase YchF [Candidatus Harrisonbacteria bacterium]
MKLSIGIVGLPNVGKSTLFNIITKNQVLAANYPFATIDPNLGTVSVPDERLSVLTTLSQSAKTIPAIVEFYDIAGLVKGASQGEGLGNQFLSHIREVKAIVHVLRCFDSQDIVHVHDSVDPLRDMDIINTELALKDLDTLEKRIKKVEGDARTGSKEAQKELELLRILHKKLENGDSIVEYSTEEAVKNLALLQAKKKLYLLNGSESDVSDELKTKIKEEGNDYIIADLSQSPDLGELIRKAYVILDLISFFTTGEDETRAWTIKKGSKAPEAAGAIHSDFEKAFIRAEVASYEDLIKSGSWTGAKQKGLLRVEGKEYIVQDGDIMNIRHG